MLDLVSTAQRVGVLDRIAPISNGLRITIRPLAAEGRLVLRLAPDIAASIKRLAGMDLTMPINRSSQGEGRIAARLGPDEWLLLVSEANAAAVLGEASAQLSGAHHALVDISHRNIAIEVAGTAAADVLNTGCPLDLTGDHFAPGQATRTLLGKAEVVVMRLSDTIDAAHAPTPRYRIECWRSFGRYLQCFLAEAAQEYCIV
jgi:sarcosine oxidase, subunit gamma